MSDLYSIVLAAGQGTRMKSKIPKVLHKIGGKTMVNHIVDLLSDVNSDEIYAVVGHKSDLVIENIGAKVNYIEQKEQLGTGHAVIQTKPKLKDKEGITIVINGDTPLITKKTIEELIRLLIENNLAATILTAKVDSPKGYGRVIRDREGGNVLKIVEEKDATKEEFVINEINTGIYCFDNQKLFKALNKLGNHNEQGEYYLTDVIEILNSQGEKIGAYVTDDLSETISINDRVALQKAEKIYRDRIIYKHMINGVTIIDPNNTYIEDVVEIGQDTIIYPGTHLQGQTKIGSDCIIGPNTEINNSIIGNKVNITHSIILSSTIKEKAIVGPFAYIRPNTQIDENVKIGDFVEIKNSTIGKNTKVPHHSYIGDAILGEDINIGCGTITVNYDGQKKHQTKIEDGVFVGCNSNLIAPVTLGKSSYIAAGSTITNDVPDSALAIARERQINKENYGNKIRDKKANNPQ